MTDRSNRRAPAFWVGLALVFSLVFPAGVAGANHNGLGLQVISGPEDDTPDTDSNPTGTTHTMTAVLVDPFTDDVATNTGSSPINIDFELESGPNNQDGSSHSTPDRSCNIAVGASTCVVEYTGGSNTGTDNWRGWIDHDGSNLTTEADLNEGRRANTEPNENPGGTTVPQPGTGCTGTGVVGDNEGVPNTDGDPRKSDCTDVVQKTWTQETPPKVPTTLDCDDSGGPDTEREVNPHNAGSASNETYTCTVQDQNGDDMSGVEVKGEVENEINDPEEPEGASYDRPDYVCETEAEDPTGEISDAAFCQITVTQADTEQGKAFICFWVGTAEEGQALCSTEPTGEGQNPNPPFGADVGNDLADKVEKAWHLDQLNCEPETDTNPQGTSHTITCTVESVARNQAGQTTKRTGMRVDVEASGANDPQNDGDTATSRRSPDFTCTTRTDEPTTPENEAGTCTITHGPGGTGSTSNTGTTTYRAWIDVDNNDNTDESDPAEGRDESTQPGNKLEPDDTDVVQKTWAAEPTALTMTPETDTAPVGSCNPYTINVTTEDGAAAQGATIDVEQRHERATNGVPNDEPQVSFCTPSEGPNPSDVDETRGDLRPPQEDPDNPGTAGGETTRSTDSQGNVTIGIMVTPANGSDGTGRVDIVAFFETTDNDDPDEGEPQDTSTKNWVASQARSIDCEPETATNRVGTEHVVTCTVRDSSGQPVQGEGVTFTESGPGTVTPTQTNTDQNGQARTTATSNETGTQTITGTLTADTQGNEPSDVDECDRAANDPQGAPAGQCSDEVTKNWTASAARTIDCEPETATNETGTQHVVTCTVRDASGQPASGEGVTFTETGPGTVSPTQATTDQNGQARTTATSNEGGTQTITGTITADTQGDEPSEVDECDRAANDPSGAPQGVCEDQVEKTWVEDEGPIVESGPCAGHREGSNTARPGGGRVIVGTSGPDELVGSPGDDLICALAGRDSIRGRGGDDEIYGDRGHDNIRGNAGDDRMFGGRGLDIIRGGAGNDVARGNGQDDTIRGFTGRDRLIGGGGNDTLRAGRGRDRLRGNAGDDILDGGPGRDRCGGGRGDDRLIRCE